MKKFFLFFGMFSVLFLVVSCKRQKTVKEMEDKYIIQPVDSFTSVDSSEVSNMVNQFTIRLNQKDIKGAVSMLSYLNGDSIIPLNRDMAIRQANALHNMQGVRYDVEKMQFMEDKDNIVKINVVLFEKAAGDDRPNTLNFYLKPVRYEGHWYLTTVDNITDTSNTGGTAIKN